MVDTDKQTKQRGEVPAGDTGLDRSRQKAKILEALSANSKQQGVLIEGYATKDSAIAFPIRTLVLRYLGAVDTNVDAVVEALPADTLERYRAPGKAPGEFKGISQQGDRGVDDSFAVKVYRPIKLILQDPVPKAIIGENAKKEFKSLTVRIPPVVSSAAIGLLLYALNKGAASDGRKILRYQTSRRQTYYTPVSEAQATDYLGRIAASKKVTKTSNP